MRRMAGLTHWNNQIAKDPVDDVFVIKERWSTNRALIFRRERFAEQSWNRSQSIKCLLRILSRIAGRGDSHNPYSHAEYPTGPWGPIWISIRDTGGTTTNRLPWEFQ